MKVLKFSASWCQPCQMLKKVIDGIDNIPIPVEDVDIDDNTEMAIKYGIRNIPTCIIISDTGDVIDRKSGMMTKEQFLTFIKV